MIRDPSDGSVKEVNPQANKINEMVDKKASEGIIDPSLLGTLPSNKSRVLETDTSGLQTGSQKAENLARLEKSRAWLQDYFNPKG